MEVVEKIASTVIKKEWIDRPYQESVFYSISSVGTSFIIGDNLLTITNNGIHEHGDIWKEVKKSSLEKTYDACLHFIKWYNEQNKT